MSSSRIISTANRQLKALSNLALSIGQLQLDRHPVLRPSDLGLRLKHTYSVGPCGTCGLVPARYENTNDLQGLHRFRLPLQLRQRRRRRRSMDQGCGPRIHSRQHRQLYPLHRGKKRSRGLSNAASWGDRKSHSHRHYQVIASSGAEPGGRQTRWRKRRWQQLRVLATAPMQQRQEPLRLPPKKTQRPLLSRRRLALSES
jgi:hypothetical protein